MPPDESRCTRSRKVARRIGQRISTVACMRHEVCFELRCGGDAIGSRITSSVFDAIEWTTTIVE